jgi:hypothetical protein
MIAPGWLLLALVLGLSVATGTPAAAQSRGRTFHDGGPGFCDGCHRTEMSAPSGGAGPRSALLRGSDASSTCLRCHAETGNPEAVFTRDGSAFTPAGDFYWLRKSFTWTRNGKSRTSPGDRRGHNVTALEYGLDADAMYPTAPGGQFPSSSLACTSCHDPHKTRAAAGVGGRPAPGASYRLLGGAGYAPAGAPAPFEHDPPVAVAPRTWAETDRNHVAYGSGMSEWCTNCHRGRSDGSGSPQHPSGRHAVLGSAIAANYNAYVRSGIMTGSPAAAYLALVPFEVGTTDASALDPSGTAGPDGRARVMCLTCHRAHASAFEHAGRWDFSTTFLRDSHPQAGDTGVTGADATNAYYGRSLASQWGPYQRSLCNKCHAKE